MRRVVVALIFLALAASVGAQSRIRLRQVGTTEPIIESSRRIDWAPGVQGGIPTRSTAFYTDTGGLDSVATLNTQIDNCTPGQVVQLQAGTYTVSSPIEIFNGCTLRGAGVSSTTLNCTASWHCVQIGDFPSAPSGINVNGPVAKGATTISVASTTGLAVDDYIVIDEINDGVEVVNDDTAFGGGECRTTNSFPQGGTRCLMQMVKITAINSTTLTVDPPIYHAYQDGALDTEIWEVVGVTAGAGLEDLTITRSNNPGGGFHNVKVVGCVGCWIEGIKSNTPDTWHVDLDRTMWSTVRDSHFANGTDYGGGQAYGVVPSLVSSANLIENNIFEHLRHSMVVQGGSSGNVFAYNYSFDCYQGENWLATDINNHGAHTTFNLWEGNIGCKVYGDNAHGSSAYNTIFRNHIWRESTPAESSQTNARRAVDIEAYNRYWNIVGNVLGLNSQSWTAYNPGATRNSGGGQYVFTFGFYCDGATDYTVGECDDAGDVNPGLGDATIVTDTFIHGNWDYQTDTQIWDAGNSNHSLPSSLYLSAKPSFFGNCAWPPFDPTGPMIGTLPAKDRHESGGVC